MSTLRFFRSRRSLILLAVIAMLLVAVPVAYADDVPAYPFAGPVFGLAASPDKSLLAADYGAGIVELRKGEGSLVVGLPGVSDMAPIGRGSMFAITGGGPEGTPLPPGARRLYRASRGNLQEVADLGAFEAAEDPDNAGVDSNPFDVEALNGGTALIADAGANALLIADMAGSVDWVATFPDELVSTNNIKALAGCPDSGADFCFLPPVFPAQAVPTSIAVGPDGAYYVGELKGFPAPTGESRVWRIEPGTLHAECGINPACSVVADGFTSIVDLAFGPDGTLYVVELDEASWAAVEIFGTVTGGTVNACAFGSWSCSDFATGLPVVTAVAVDKTGAVHGVINGLFGAQVVALP